MYALVKDNKIIRYFDPLPKSYENMSNFHLLPDSEKRKFFVYPVLEERPAYDPRLEVAEGPIESFNGDAVLQRWTIRDKTDEELAAQKIADLRNLSFGRLDIFLKLFDGIFGQLVAAGILNPQDMDPETIQEFAKLRGEIKKPIKPGPPTPARNV